MSKYLRKFETQAAYQAAQANLERPNVSLIEEGRIIGYNPYVEPTPTLDALKFTVLQGTGTLTFTMAGGVNDANNNPGIDYVEWSTDGENWNRTNYDYDNGNLVETDELEAGDVCYFRGSARNYSLDYYNGSGFMIINDNLPSSPTSLGGAATTLENIKVEGKLMAMLGTETFGVNENKVFEFFFSSNNILSDASGLILPNTTIEDCYTRMFDGCVSLTAAPALPATTLADGCYSCMFNGCTSLTTAPALPATTLAYRCYAWMFSDCTNLTTAPELPAATLADQCYYDMFQYCSSLNYIKMLATDISATECLSSWVEYAGNGSGTFVKASSMTSLPTGNDGIPTGWTVENV